MDHAVASTVVFCLASLVLSASALPLETRTGTTCLKLDEITVIVGTPAMKENRVLVRDALIASLNNLKFGDGRMRLAFLLFVPVEGHIVSKFYDYSNSKETLVQNVEDAFTKLGQLEPLDKNPPVHLAAADALDIVIKKGRKDMYRGIFILNDREVSDAALYQKEIYRARANEAQVSVIQKGPKYFPWVKMLLPLMAKGRCQQP